MADFNLVHDAWVPVTVAGQWRAVSLLDALTFAHEIDGLALDDPLECVAVLRQVLLPVVLDALGVPRNEQGWVARWHAERLDADRLGEYLTEHAERFELFHPTRPFGQAAGLRTERNDTKPVSVLLPAAAAGNNVPLFSTRTEADPPALSPAAAVRALLTAQCWDTAAIKSGAIDDSRVKAGKTTGNPTGPLGQLGVVIPIGRTLAQTLHLNTPIVRQGLRETDRPQWLAGSAATGVWQERSAAGPRDLLTWQARRVRLIPETDGGATVVRRVVLTAGDRLTQVPQYEPHTAWKRVDKPQAGKPPQRPVRHQPGRSAWRGLAGLLATGQPTKDGVSSSELLTQLANLRADGHLSSDLPLQVLTVGVSYGNQSAVIEDVMVDVIPLPVVALATGSAVRGLLLDVVAQADALREAANWLGDDLRRAMGGDKLPWDKSQRLGDALIHQFTPVVRRLLAGLQRQPDRVDNADVAWRQAARRLALDAVEPALAAAPPEAFLGRQQGEKVYRVSVAEARFRAAVNRILGTHNESSQDQSKLTTGV